VLRCAGRAFTRGARFGEGQLKITPSGLRFSNAVMFAYDFGSLNQTKDGRAVYQRGGNRDWHTRHSNIQRSNVARVYIFVNKFRIPFIS
jgi:hypothetical protein